MGIPLNQRTALCVVVSVLLSVVTLGEVQPVRAADSDVEALRGMIEGIYVLEEWHTDAGVFSPPQVDGRFVLLNGAVVVFLRNRIQEANQTTIAAYGTYTLTGNEFAYGYEEPSVFTQTGSGITVSNKRFWEGMRSFSASRDAEAVRLSSASGEEFVFSRAGLKYSQKGKVQRVWRRIPAA